MATSRCDTWRRIVLAGAAMGILRFPVGVVRIACGMPLAVLLPLLRTVLLGEIGDTLSNAMRAFGQRVLTALHFGLDLLAKRPTGGSCRRTAAEGACRYDCREDRHGRFVFDRCRQCGGKSGCHCSPRFISSRLTYMQGACA